MAKVLSKSVLAIAGACVWWVSQPGTALAACHGDCGGNGGVTAEELRRVVWIINACGGDPDGCAAVPGADKQCTSADVDGDGTLTAADLTAIINDDVIGMNPDCDAGGLGTRLLTIRQSAGANPANIATGFFSTGAGQNGGEVTVDNSWFITNPLKIHAGTPDAATGIAALRLEEDVIFGGQVISQGAVMGPTLCVKLFAQGSSGQLDCDGGSPQDVFFEVDSRQGPCADPNVCGALPRCGRRSPAIRRVPAPLPWR